MLPVPLNSSIDDFVHAAAGLHQRGGDDGEAAAVFDIARRAEEALGLVAARRDPGRRKASAPMGGTTRL